MKHQSKYAQTIARMATSVHVNLADQAEEYWNGGFVERAAISYEALLAGSSHENSVGLRERFEILTRLVECRRITGDITLAEEYLDAAENLCRMSLNWDEYGSHIITLRCNMLISTGQYAEASNLSRREIWRLTHGRRDEQHLIELLNLAGVSARYLGEMTSAKMFLMLSYRAVLKHDGERSIKLAPILHNLSGVCYAMQNFCEGLEWGRRAMLLRSEWLGPGHPGVAEDRALLGAHLVGEERFSEGIAELLAARQVFVSCYGEACYDVACTDNNLGVAHMRLGDFREAQNCFECSLRTKVEIFGERHPEVGVALHNLGVFFFVKLEIAHAISLLKRAEVTFVRVLGPLHSRTKATRECLDKALHMIP